MMMALGNYTIQSVCVDATIEWSCEHRYVTVHFWHRLNWDDSGSVVISLWPIGINIRPGSCWIMPTYHSSVHYPLQALPNIGWCNLLCVISNFCFCCSLLSRCTVVMEATMIQLVSTWAQNDPKLLEVVLTVKVCLATYSEKGANFW